MKKLLVLLAMVIALSLVAVSCGKIVESPSQSSDTQKSEATSSSVESTEPSKDETESTEDDTDESVDEEAGSSENVDSSYNTDVGVDSNDETEESVDTSESVADSEVEDSVDSSETVDSSVDSETDESISDSEADESTADTEKEEDTTDSSKEEELPPVDVPDKEEEEVELNQGIPDGPIDIAIGGVSSYVIVYEAGNTRVEAFTTKFVEYMQKTHKITFEVISDDQENTNELCIYIGNVKGIKRVKEKMNAENDFGDCVFGNDYALYATNDRLYDFLFDALQEKVLFTIRNGNWSTKPGKDFIYSKSDLKDVDYADYVLEKYKNIIDHDYLRTIFESLSFTASDGTTLPYRLYVPYHYDNTKEYPVLLFLHGAGERGTNNTGNIYHMFKELFSLEDSPLWNSIIIAPQCPEGQQWVDTPWVKGEYSVDEVPESNELKAVLELLEAVEKEFPTDKDRYYVMGLSMGGFGTWDLIMRHSDIFAAAVPICGGGDSSQAEKLVDMPIYTLHCKDDKDVPFLGTRVMIVSLKAYGSTVLKYEELSGYGHNVWGYASRKAEIWTWLYEQTREGR